MNYKRQDKEAVEHYLAKSRHPVLMDELRICSGADPLRIYPILFEMQQEGKIVCRHDPLGYITETRLVTCRAKRLLARAAKWHDNLQRLFSGSFRHKEIM